MLKKKILVFLLIILIIFAILYFYHSIRQRKNSNSVVEFSSWNEDILLTDEHKEIFLKDIDIIDNKENIINFDKNINIHIGKDIKDKKTIGVFIIKAKYDKIGDIERQFKKFNVKINDEAYSRPIYIINETNYSVSINNISQNECDIIFVTNLPYRYEKTQNTDENYSQKVEYFVRENAEQEKKIKNNKSKIIIIFTIVIEASVTLIYYITKFINKNHRE